MNQKAHVACNFNCFIENEELLKVTGSHVHSKFGNISETVHDRSIDTTDHRQKAICGS